MKWSPWPGGSTRRFHVKVNQLKLHGFSCENEREKALLIEVKWKGPKKNGGPSGVLMAPFYGRSRCQKNYTGRGFFGKGEIVEWDDEFQSLCNFGSKQSAAPWDLTFTFVHVSFFLFNEFILLMFLFDIIILMNEMFFWVCDFRERLQIRRVICRFSGRFR